MMAGSGSPSGATRPPIGHVAGKRVRSAVARRGVDPEPVPRLRSTPPATAAGHFGPAFEAGLHRRSSRRRGAPVPSGGRARSRRPPRPDNEREEDADRGSQAGVVVRCRHRRVVHVVRGMYPDGHPIRCCSPTGVSDKKWPCLRADVRDGHAGRLRTAVPARTLLSGGSNSQDLAGIPAGQQLGRCQRSRSWTGTLVIHRTPDGCG